VDHLAVSRAGYTVDPEGFTLGVQQRSDVEVTFAPTREGASAGTLTISSDDPDTSSPKSP